MLSNAHGLHQYTSQKDIEDVQYVMFLIMVRAGNEFT